MLIPEFWADIRQPQRKSHFFFLPFSHAGQASYNFLAVKPLTVSWQHVLLDLSLFLSQKAEMGAQWV